jgi:tetratricopeptide (TPR) repeat protein
VYWKSLLVGKNKKVSMDELIALVKGIFQKETSLKTKKPPADVYQITAFAKIEYEDSVIESRVRKFNKNRFMFNRFMESQQREKKLIDNLNKLEERYSKEHFLSFLVHKQRKKFFQNEFHRIARQLKAVELNEKALYLFPNYENTIDYWGNLARAKDFMSKAIQLDPNYAGYYYFRGVIYGKELFDDSALEDFSQAIRLDPNYADPYVSRAFIYSLSQQYDLARSDAKRACELGNCIAKIFFEALDICGGE